MVILSNGKVANWRKEVLDAEEGKAVIREVLRLYPNSSPELHETIDGLHVWAVVEKPSMGGIRTEEWIITSGEYCGERPLYTHVWTGKLWSKNFDAAKKFPSQETAQKAYKKAPRRGDFGGIERIT